VWKRQEFAEPDVVHAVVSESVQQNGKSGWHGNVAAQTLIMVSD
jgi:hypothetical protein